MIERVQRANPHLTNAAIARAAEVSKTTVTNWRAGDLKRLEADRLRRLALVLDVPLSEVVRAALVSMGLHIDHGLTLEQAIKADPDLNQRDKRSLLALLANYRQQGRKESRDEQGSTRLRAARDAPDDETFRE